MFRRAVRLSLIPLIILVLGNATISLADVDERVRAFTRPIEFDYVSWTLDAIGVKLEQAALGEASYLEDGQGSQLVREYSELISRIERMEAELSFLHANPESAQVTAQIDELNDQLGILYVERLEKGPQAESVLQGQLGAVLADMGLTFVGQPIPPVLYHSTPLPWALIVSPRDRIAQEANISLETELTLAEHIALEDSVSDSLDVSALVVPVGGIGSYPTMVAQSSNLNWITEVIAHEWIHNYLTLRPLGLLYDRNQELRSMNETAANIAGKELGAALIKRFYPELVPPAPAAEEEAAADAREEELLVEEQGFDFRAEMHETRIQVDQFLAEGKISEAEEYMETRRLLFWENGFPIRTLNQAYFAFYGSYADQPRGPAGEDPVGEAVRTLRERSSSLDAFIKEMAFITSFEQLQRKLD
jgi:hypothetical protein